MCIRDSSYIVVITVFAIGFLVLAISKGDFDILISPTMIKWLFWGSLYLLSIYFIYTIKDKPFKRRLATWWFSIIFHFSLMCYLAFVLKLGFAAFVVGAVESAIIVLSIAGLVSCLNTKNEPSA